MKQVLVSADMNTTYVQAGEEAWVDLTPQVKALIEAGTLYDLTPPAAKRGGTVKASSKVTAEKGEEMRLP